MPNKLAAHVQRAQEGKGATCAKCGKPAPQLYGKEMHCKKCWNAEHQAAGMKVGKAISPATKGKITRAARKGRR